MKTVYRYILLICLLFGIGSCKKFLETKSDQKLARPETLEDLQLLLDNPAINNGTNLSNTGSDEYYVEHNDWQNLADELKLGYIWDPKLNDLSDWQVQYNNVFVANTILFNLDYVSHKSLEQKSNSIRGAALFLRALGFYNIAQLYAPQYVSATATTDLGIPLRLNANFNDASFRSSLQQTYDQIISDLEAALPLLSNSFSIKTRPGKAACNALLARVYLQMGNYPKAKEVADACLALHYNIIDYNDLNPNDPYPLGDFQKNGEILYYIKSTGLNMYDFAARVDSQLLKSYDSNDLRKQVYFKDNGNGTYAFKGNYSGGFDLFNGLATDEVLLIRAEANARSGNRQAALSDIDSLLIKRFKTGTFVPLVVDTDDKVVELIVKERTKELVYRGTRWADLRRLNIDPKYAVTLKRVLNGTSYELLPNDSRYSLLIPLEVMRLSNLPQNPR